MQPIKTRKKPQNFAQMHGWISIFHDLDKMANRLQQQLDTGTLPTAPGNPHIPPLQELVVGKIDALQNACRFIQRRFLAMHDEYAGLSGEQLQARITADAENGLYVFLESALPFEARVRVARAKNRDRGPNEVIPFTEYLQSCFECTGAGCEVCDGDGVISIFYDDDEEQHPWSDFLAFFFSPENSKDATDE